MIVTDKGLSLMLRNDFDGGYDACWAVARTLGQTAASCGEGLMSEIGTDATNQHVGFNVRGQKRTKYARFKFFATLMAAIAA